MPARAAGLHDRRRGAATPDSLRMADAIVLPSAVKYTVAPSFDHDGHAPPLDETRMRPPKPDDDCR